MKTAAVPSMMLLVAAIAATDAYVATFSSSRSSAFLGGPRSRPVAPVLKSSSSLVMDLEQFTVDVAARYQLVQAMKQDIVPTSPPTLAQAQAVHGMPWKSSIDPKVTDEELLYMPFWEWQMSFMKDNLTNLRVVPCTSKSGEDMSYNANTQKKARIVNLCASSDEYRKIRLTYYDAGDNTQVFNAVFYPDPKYNLPILGVDLLAFNRKKYLAIVDFQPLHENEQDHAALFQHRLEPIKDQFESLKGRMSSKFYDETKFFSQQMLFSRFEDESIISNQLFPAFTAYVHEHLLLLRDTTPNSADVKHVLERQQAYDTYSAERDPATGLFTAMFGQEWAMDFVHDFLFSMSERPSSVAPQRPPPAGAAAAPAASHRAPAVVASRR